MFDKNQALEAINNSKVAGRDLIDNSINYFANEVQHDSAIANVLNELLDIVSDTKYEKPDTIEYTIEDKIDYNKLVKYKEFFDDYMENYNFVREKIMMISEEKPTFENRLINYIKSKYIKFYNDKLDSNKLLDTIINDIELELKKHSSLTLEDISYVHYVVFYIFAICKIFKKPKRSIS